MLRICEIWRADRHPHGDDYILLKQLQYFVIVFNDFVIMFACVRNINSICFMNILQSDLPITLAVYYTDVP